MEGKPWNGTRLGYRYRNGVYVIEPDEAETVRRIFREYLSGKGIVSIANDLNADGVRTRYENAWEQGRRFTHPAQLRLLRKPASSEDFPGKPPDEKEPWSTRAKANCRCTTQRVRTRPLSAWRIIKRYRPKLQRGPRKYAPVGKCFTGRYPFSSLIACDCGKHYRRKITATGPVWICSTDNYQGNLCRLSLQADTGAYADGHDRGIWILAI